MMMVRVISSDVASKAWNAWENEEEFDGGAVVYDLIGDGVEGGEVLSDLELEPLAESLCRTMRDGGTDVSKDKAGSVDSSIIEAVHGVISRHVSVHALSQIGFWRWLSNIACDGAFWRFIKWRFDSDKQVNWGIATQSKIVEVYFYRAWLRGHRMHDPELQDPYHYAKLGSSDVWRSHILRQDFGRDRDFVKALLDTIYDSEGKTKIQTKELREKLIPALRAWTSSATFTHLSYEENLVLIEKLHKDGI